MSDSEPIAPKIPAESTSPKSGSSPKDKKEASTSPKNASSPPDAETGLLPAQHWVQVAAEAERETDADSAVGSNNSSTTSISSSILHYRTIHGRTFHSERGDTQYWASNDEAQNEALDITHHALMMLLGEKLYLAPLKDVQTAIDIGTGTGIWAIDFADDFPDATVIGTDLSPIQPSWVPPNVQFQIDDCTQEWTFQENSADYVHFRWLVGSIADWTFFMKEAFKTLKPGGYIESHEGSPNIQSDDDTVHDRTAMSQWGKIFIEGSKKIGRSFTVIEDGLIKKAMEEAGFVDINVSNYKCPVGGWARDPKLAETGEYMRLAFEQDAEGALLFMGDLQGWSKEEITVYGAQLRRELRQNRNHPYFPSQVIYARKPLDAAS